MMVLLVSCSSISEDLDSLGNKDVAEGNKEYVVSIGMTGEILDISQVPLTKAGGNDLYGIQVYVKPKANETVSYQRYAYGLFDDVSDLSITLFDGYLYKFVATCVIDGKNKIGKNYNPNTGVINYYSPFGSYLQNKFIYDSSEGLYSINYVSEYTSDVTNIQPDRYYGEMVNFDPSQAEEIDIEMLKCMAGMKLVVSGMTEGELIISFNNTAYHITPDDTKLEIETVFELSDVGHVWQYEKISPKSIYFTDKFLRIAHKHSSYNNIFNYEEIIYDSYVRFTRNKQTLIKVNISSNQDTDTPTEGSNGVNITLEDAGELTPGEEVVIGEEENVTEE